MRILTISSFKLIKFSQATISILSHKEKTFKFSLYSFKNIFMFLLSNFIVLFLTGFDFIIISGDTFIINFINLKITKINY